MDTNKNTFNFTILYIVVYIALAVLVLIYIWFPKGINFGISNSKFTYEDVDEKQKAIDMYKVKVTLLLKENDLEQLYQKLDDEYKSKYHINEDNFQFFLEESSLISKKDVSLGECSVNIQNGDIYVYRFSYLCNNKSKYVNVIETKPDEYTLSFE